MKKSQKTFRALIGSIVSLSLCFSMFVGSTYAWFTDTATTGVNQIQSGILDVDLVDDAGASLVGQSLAFKAADNRDTILWEPGCTYELGPVFVKNNGNLALKYELVINGIDGDAKLLEAIEWTVEIDGTATDLSTFVGHLDTQDAVSDDIVIRAHMKEEAGNEYQNLTISGLGLTVYATQYTYEQDMIDETYDENADLGFVPRTTAVQNGNASFASPVAPADNKSTTVAITSVDAADDDFVTLSIDVDDLEEANSNFVVEDNHTAVAGIDLNLTDTAGQNVTFDGGEATITTYILPGLDPANVTVKYDGTGTQPTLVSYDAATGKLVFTTTHFSSYYVDYNGSFAYIPQLNRAIASNDVIDEILIYAANSVEGLYDAINVEAMTAAFGENYNVYSAIYNAMLSSSINGSRPNSVDYWVMDYVKGGKTKAEIIQMAQQYHDAFEECLDSTKFYPIVDGPTGWVPWPMIESPEIEW